MLVVDAYYRVELCTPTWLNHDYGDGGVVDILVVDAYSEVDVCTPIFMGETSNQCGWQIIFKKISKLKWTHPIAKLNTNKSCYSSTTCIFDFLSLPLLSTIFLFTPFPQHVYFIIA
jgi:hypothetical protein